MNAGKDPLETRLGESRVGDSPVGDSPVEGAPLGGSPVTSRPIEADGARSMTIEEVAITAEAVMTEIEMAVIGKREQLHLILMAFLANGHVLIDDVPGVAKTLIARSFAQVFGMSFARLQMTPDVLPSDITGSQVLDASRNLVFRPGPVFANLLLADEVNRATPKAQAALLEAMEERQVSADGVTHQLDRPFLVIATQNPVEFEGTYPLPEAQLDRFLLRLKIGYPSADDEWLMVERRLQRGRDESNLRVVVSKAQLLQAQRGIERVHVSEAVGRYAVGCVRATRALPNVTVGSSPRGTLAIVKLARARAAMDGRGFVLPDDVKAVAPSALAHRVMLAPEMWVRGIDASSVIQSAMSSVPVPSAADAIGSTV
jgi:MoxR-like ATPase